MSKKKKYLLIAVYTVLLLGSGFFLVFFVSHVKFSSRIEVIRDANQPLDERIRALSMIADYHSPEVTDAVLSCLNDNDPFMRMRAAQVAGVRRDYKAVPYLIRNLKDNTLIPHRASGTPFPQVKIYSYQALKKITGRDFGRIEGHPTEVAETIRQWDAWWHNNAHLYGEDVADISIDYETVVLNPSLDIARRLEYLIEAEQRESADIEGIVLELLQRTQYSLLKRRAIILAGRRRMILAVPFLIETIISPETVLIDIEEVPFPAIWANGALVQITGHDIGPVTPSMSVSERNRIRNEWKAYFETSLGAIEH